MLIVRKVYLNELPTDPRGLEYWGGREIVLVDDGLIHSPHWTVEDAVAAALALRADAQKELEAAQRALEEAEQRVEDLRELQILESAESVDGRDP